LTWHKSHENKEGWKVKDPISGYFFPHLIPYVPGSWPRNQRLEKVSAETYFWCAGPSTFTLSKILYIASDLVGLWPAPKTSTSV
jgi:hypothetical protein